MQIKSKQVVLFFIDIVHRFRVPNSIITDNDTQFPTKCSLVSTMITISAWIGQPWHTPDERAGRAC
jgi:hypothetical protein